MNIGESLKDVKLRSKITKKMSGRNKCMTCVYDSSSTQLYHTTCQISFYISSFSSKIHSQLTCICFAKFRPDQLQ